MARIPLGNFGNVMPQAAQGRVIDTGGQYVAQAVSNLSQAVQNYGEVENKLQAQEDEHQYNLEVPRYKAEAEETYKAINQDVATGVLTPDEAEKVWGEKSASLIDSYKSRIPLSRTKQFEELGASTYYGGVPNLRDTGFKVGVQKQQTEAAISVEATLKNLIVKKVTLKLLSSSIILSLVILKLNVLKNYMNGITREMLLKLVIQ